MLSLQKFEPHANARSQQRLYIYNTLIGIAASRNVPSDSRHRATVRSLSLSPIHIAGTRTLQKLSLARALIGICIAASTH